jgi:hypothetical protein
MSKTHLSKYSCDAFGCDATVTAGVDDQMQPDGWLFLCAWVVGAGGNGVNDPEHYCPRCSKERLKALGRAY